MLPLTSVDSSYLVYSTRTARYLQRFEPTMGVGTFVTGLAMSQDNCRRDKGTLAPCGFQ